MYTLKHCSSHCFVFVSATLYICSCHFVGATVLYLYLNLQQPCFAQVAAISFIGRHHVLYLQEACFCICKNHFFLSVATFYICSYHACICSYHVLYLQLPYFVAIIFLYLQRTYFVLYLCFYICSSHVLYSFAILVQTFKVAILLLQVNEGNTGEHFGGGGAYKI